MFHKILLSSIILIGNVFFFSCVSDDINKVDCDTTDLAITTSVTNLTVCTPPNGSITANATGGKSPYTFSIDGTTFSSTQTFNNLSAGTYILTVRDANDCDRTVEATVGGVGVAASATVDIDSGCKGTNGKITVTASNGTQPYTYKLGNASFVSSNTFTSLATNTYQVTVKDAGGCEFVVAGIKVTSGVSYQNDIKPILEANCIKSGCHNGDNGAQRNWSVFANVQAKASGIKTRTGNKSMPKDIAPTGLPQNQIDLIACWVDDGALDN